MEKYALWLPSWYPNKINHFDGDFIERHAKAVSEFEKLMILFVIKDSNQKEHGVIIEKIENKNITLYKAYYNKRFRWPVAEKIFSLFTFFLIQKKIFKQIVEENGLPEIVHVHVAMKAGLLALWLKKKFQIPFVVTEHWTGYWPDAKPNIYSANWLFKKLNKKILSDASLFLPVSHSLGEVVNKKFIPIPFHVISNAVNTNLFFFKPTAIKRFRFIHPSSMNYFKNPEGILAACKIVLGRGYAFELILVGNESDEIKERINELGLSQWVTIKSAVPYEEVARLIQDSSALLMFSRFENLPCVILEALCCGLPVVSSNVGGIPEIINEQNGILVNSEDVGALSDAMIKMMEHYSSFDRIAISQAATRLYQYQKIGADYKRIYEQILAKTKM